MTRRAGSARGLGKAPRKGSFDGTHDDRSSFKGMQKWQTYTGTAPMDRLQSLGTSFKRQLEEYKAPSLGRLASTWDMPSVFPDAGISIPQVDLDVQSSEAKALDSLCVHHLLRPLLRPVHPLRRQVSKAISLLYISKLRHFSDPFWSSQKRSTTSPTLPILPPSLPPLQR